MILFVNGSKFVLAVGQIKRKQERGSEFTMVISKDCPELDLTFLSKQDERDGSIGFEAATKHLNGCSRTGL